MSIKAVFFGTAELACASLRALTRDARVELVAVVTQPDKPKGRELRLQPPPVKQAALGLGLPVLQPIRARDPGFLETLRQFAPDLILVAAYGQILPRALLDIPRHGCLNVHTSLLPKYRGAAPIQRAMLEGDTITGVTIMKIDAGLDTGPILSQERVPILPSDDAATLHDRLAALGAELLCRTLPGHLAGTVQPWPQPPAGATYAPKITRKDGWVDWTRPAPALWNQVRALTPWPVAWTSIADAPQLRLLKIWRAELAGALPLSPRQPGEVLGSDAGLLVGCGSGSLRLLELQREGGRRLDARSFLLGHPLPAGTLLGGSRERGRLDS